MNKLVRGMESEKEKEKFINLLYLSSPFHLQNPFTYI